MSNSLFIYYLVALIYLFDEKVNQFFEINGIGFLFVLSLFSYIHFKDNKKFFLSIPILLGIIFFSVYEAISITLSPCTLSIKSLISFILVIPYFYLIRSGFILNIISIKKIRNLIIFTTLLLLLIHFYGGESYRFIRAQYEYSWTALYILPFIVYNLLLNKYDKFSIIALFIIAFTSLSSTFLLILVFLFLYIAFKSKINYIFIPLSMVIPIIFFYYIESFFERVVTIIHYSDSEYLNLSSLVWLNGFSMAENYLSITNGLGVGFNSMGCSNDPRFYGSYMNQILSISDSYLNILDGSFLASKLISELGIFGLVLVIFLVLKCIHILFKRASNLTSLKPVDHINVVGAIFTISFLFIRGGGYFQLGFILSLSMLFAFSSKRDKNYL